MAHEFESGLFVSQPAWHGLGTLLETAPSVADAIQLAGLDWQVKEAPVFLESGKRVTTHRAMIRTSDGSCLGIVGNGFTPLQNSDAFKWFQPMIDTGDATIEAAGSLREGRRIWILAALKGATVDVARNDAVKAHVLLAHGHDGSLAIRAGFTRTRVVCANTLRVAMRNDAKQLLKLSHTKNATVALEAARESFDLQRAELKADADKYRFLAKRKCDDKNLVRYVREVLSPGSADDAEKTVQNVDKIVENFESGRGAELSRGTMWGAFNAITEYATHQRGRSADTRQASNWFGGGAKLTDRALDVAMVFAENAPLAELAREAARNTASARLETNVLMGKPRRAAAPPTSESGDFASLLGRPSRMS